MGSSSLTTHLITTAAMEQIIDLEEMLDSVEERMNNLVQKPSTRVQACQLLAKAKDLQREVADFPLPDLEAEYSDEEGDRLDNALDKYNDLRQSLAEVQAKAETLCVCWNKLDQDVSELTKAITSGGGSKVTMEHLEESIRTLKEMFIERKPVIEKVHLDFLDGYRTDIPDTDTTR